jgi:phage-related protein
VAQGFKVADAYIEIHTEDDTTDGRRKIDRDTTRWAKGLAPRLGRIFGLGMLAGIGKALMQALAVTAKLAAFGILAGVVASAVGGLAAAIANLIPIIAELVNALIAASGALLLIPAAIAAIITVVATVKLGLKGMGEAMKAVGSGDAKVLAEALKKLAPQARAFVRELARAKPAFDRMRLQIQNRLFAGLAGHMRELARLTIPLLTVRLKEMAGVLNGVLRDAIQFLVSRRTQLDLSQILNASARSADNLRKGLVPVLSILRDIVAVGAQLIAKLTGGFGQAMAGFAETIAQMRASGDLEKLILDGLAAAKALVLLLGDIVGIVRSLVRAAGGAGGLFSFFDRLNRMLQSVEGQSVLRELFNDLDRIGRALIPVLLALLKALMPVIDAVAGIAEAFSPALTVLLLALGNALSLLEGPIKALAPLIFELSRGLAPFALILGQLVRAATPGLTAFLAALVDALITLVPVAPVVGRALGDLLKALAPLLEVLGPTLGVLLASLAGGLSAIARVLGPVIALFAQFASRILTRMLPLLIDMVERLLPVFAEQGQKVFDAFAPLIPIFAEFVEIWLAQAAANLPIVMQAFADILPVIGEVAAVFGGALLAAWKALLPEMPRLIKAFSDLSLAFLAVLVALAPLLPPLARFLAEIMKILVETGLLRFAINFLIGVLVVATDVIRRVARGVEVFIGWLVGARNTASSFGKAVSAAVQTALSLFSRLGSTIRNAVGNLGNLLFQAGRNVIDGLIRGIRSMIGNLTGALSNIAGIVRDYWPFSPAKRGPLSGRGDMKFAGQNLVDRLIEGVAERFGAAGRTAASLAGVFAGPMGGPVPALAGSPNGMTLAAAAAAAGRGQPPPGTFGPYRLELDSKVVAEFAIDAVTGNPKRIAAVAQEGTRQRAFLSTSRAR